MKIEVSFIDVYVDYNFLGGANNHAACVGLALKGPCLLEFLVGL